MRIQSITNRVIATLFLLLVSATSLSHGISEETRQRMIDGGNFQYLVLGAEHMVTGYDHLLFLFGVMFFLSRFVSIVKFVTAFTIGHTITLVFATYLGITVNYFLIDAVIAMTVIYKGFENIDGFRRYLNVASPNLLVAVFVFGLIHGFGLSTRLQELPIRDDSGLLMHILSFNVGVEVGQVLALIVMGAVLSIWRKKRSFESWSGIANGALMAAGVFLLSMQLHGFAHSAFPDDFPINRDDHAHAHDELNTDSPVHTHNPDGSHPPGVPDHGPEFDSSQDSANEGDDIVIPEHN
jgi:hypothetical protein